MHCTTLEDDVLCNGQQPDSNVNSFIKCEVMKMLSGCKALHRDKHQFHAKMTVSTC